MNQLRENTANKSVKLSRAVVPIQNASKVSLKRALIRESCKFL